MDTAKPAFLPQDSTARLGYALHNARSVRHRVLVVLSGTQTWCVQQASVWYASAENRVWIGDEASHAKAIAASKARQVLGSEYALAVLDAHAGLSPDVLAAVSGTVLAGGVLVLLTPPWQTWGTTPDPDYVRFASYPENWRDMSCHFLSRIRDALAMFPDAAGTFLHWQEKTGDDDAVTTGLAVLPLPPVVNACAGVLPTSRQQHCLDLLQAHDGVSVLLADRGYGKSATLGFAARRWIALGKNVLLVAPSRAAVASVFRHAGDGLQFSAPDNVLADENLSADVLLVDEAAAIPLPMLLSMLDRFPQVVLATTTGGYEGTGRGFVLRFMRELDRRYPSWQYLQLDEPVRWAADDSLSSWLYRTLLLDAEEQVLLEESHLPVAVFEKVPQQRLAQDAVLLTDIYGLLRSAHYRTTPDDLRFLLDAPHLSLYRLVLDGCTLAVAMVVEEGSMDAAMAKEIAAGRRRPRGHLLVQTLAVHLQQPQYLQRRVARVVRIAVHTQYQGRGSGSRLLQEVVREKRKEGIFAMGSSFSASPDVLRFWQTNGFDLLRVGRRRQAASAEPSALVLKVLAD